MISSQFLSRQADFQNKKKSKLEAQAKEEADRYTYKPAVSDMSKLILKKKASREASRDISKLSGDSMADDNVDWDDNSKIIDFETVESQQKESLRQKLAENLKKIQSMEKEYQRASKIKDFTKTQTVVSSRLYQPGKTKRQEVKYNTHGSIAVVVDKYRTSSKSPPKIQTEVKKTAPSKSGLGSIQAYFSGAYLTNS